MLGRNRRVARLDTQGAAGAGDEVKDSLRPRFWGTLDCPGFCEAEKR